MKSEARFELPTKLSAQWPAWLIGGAFILAFTLRDVLTSDGLVINHSVLWGRDFVNVWTGGHLVRDGRIATLFDLHAYALFQQSLFGPLDPHNYSYPPVTYPIAALFSLLPYPVALAAWTLGTGALFVAACKRWWPKRAGPVFLAALTPAALVNTWAGHYGFLIGALFLAGWQLAEKRPHLAGIAFGLMLIKPHMAALVPLVLLIRRDWRVIATAALTVAALVGASGLWFGWQSWAWFLFRTSAVQASMIDAGQTFFGLMSTSVSTAVLHLTGSWSAALTAQWAAAAYGVTLTVIAARRGMATRRLAFLTATCTFLVLPYAFNYDLTVVAVGALVLMSSPGITADQKRLATIGFMSAQLGMVTALLGVPLMPLMLAGLAFAQFRCWCPDLSARRTPAAQPFKPDTATLA